MPTSSPQPPGLVMWVFPLMLILIWYVLVIQPQSKARTTHEQMLKNLKKHDEVVTSGGMIGIIVNIKPTTVTLRVDDNVRIEVEKSAISRLLKSHVEDAAVSPSEKRS